jgi:hypothetical protein
MAQQQDGSAIARSGKVHLEMIAEARRRVQPGLSPQIAEPSRQHRAQTVDRLLNVARRLNFDQLANTV